MIDFEKFIKQCDEICEINTKYIEEFVDELSKKGFVDKTIKRHYGNVDFYLNDCFVERRCFNYGKWLQG